MIRVHQQLNCLTIIVEGPATMKESPAVQTLAAERLASGTRSVRVDLRDCTTVDSTFTGTLLAIERQCETVNGTLKLVSPSRHVMEQLHEMGLEDFYAIEQADRAEGACTELAAPAPETERLRRAIVEAHDELARIPGAAGAAFRAVADELRRDEPYRPRAAAKGRPLPPPHMS